MRCLWSRVKNSGSASRSRNSKFEQVMNWSFRAEFSCTLLKVSKTNYLQKPLGVFWNYYMWPLWFRLEAVFLFLWSAGECVARALNPQIMQHVVGSPGCQHELTKLTAKVHDMLWTLHFTPSRRRDLTNITLAIIANSSRSRSCQSYISISQNIPRLQLQDSQVPSTLGRHGLSSQVISDSRIFPCSSVCTSSNTCSSCKGVDFSAQHRIMALLPLPKILSMVPPPVKAKRRPKNAANEPVETQIQLGGK